MEFPRLPRQIGQVTIIGFLLAVAAAWLYGWLTEEVLEGDMTAFDTFVRNAVHAGASPGLTAFMEFWTTVGSIIVVCCLFVIALALFWFSGWRRAAVLLIITMAGAGILEFTLKLAFHRARPTPWFGLAVPSTFSYPSGHATFAFVFYATLASLTTARVKRRWRRAAIWIAAACVIAAIGFSRIYLGVHYPTDVLAGYLTGLIWVLAVSMADRHFRPRSA